MKCDSPHLGEVGKRLSGAARPPVPVAAKDAASGRPDVSGRCAAHSPGAGRVSGGHVASTGPGGAEWFFGVWGEFGAGWSSGGHVVSSVPGAGVVVLWFWNQIVDQFGFGFVVLKPNGIVIWFWFCGFETKNPKPKPTWFWF